MKKLIAGLKDVYSNEVVIAETNSNFFGIGPILSFWRNQHTETALDEMYKVKRLHWALKLVFADEWSAFNFCTFF